MNHQQQRQQQQMMPSIPVRLQLQQGLRQDRLAPAAPAAGDALWFTRQTGLLATRADTSCQEVVVSVVVVLVLLRPMVVRAVEHTSSDQQVTNR